ncbi:MAG: hypothetical protein PHO06_02870 [Clostridia bacterium]|jgi:hypothetical protein|nr:hypothetical protein [Clostridia bacterium]
MKNYFRITGYCPEHDFSFIVDSKGMFEKFWQFSSYLIQKGLKVLEISNSEKFIDINIKPIEEDKNLIMLRATVEGKPEYLIQEIDGTQDRAIKVADKTYIPNIEM